MKAINLKSLIDAHEQLDNCTFCSYLQIFGLALSETDKHDGIRKQELECIKHLIRNMEEHCESIQYADNFFVGYTIPQIGKEFALLRINENSVINIELKSEAGEDKILKQLKRNSYYLSFLKQAREPQSWRMA